MTEMRLRGKINWFEKRKGFGFIRTENHGDVFFHISNVIDLPADQILPDMEVFFVLSKGKRVENAHEATQVTLGSASPATIQPKDFLESIIRKNDTVYNDVLFKHLKDGINEINDEQSYNMAIALLKYSQGSKPHKDLLEHCLAIANAEYRMKFWLDKIVDDCDLKYLSQRLQESTTEQLDSIHLRLEDYNLNAENKQTTVLFENIQAQILKELDSAKKHIKIAVAWFTHHRQFDILLKKLSQNVSVDLVIINDYINNWPFGLPFAKFIEAGGKLYLTGPDRIMHHKFCIIDEQVLMNGSYNWTYYAAERNQENCMFFYGHRKFINAFNSVFLDLISALQPIEGELPPAFISDVFSRRAYQSMDLQYKALSRPVRERNHAIALIKKALELNPENQEAKTLLQNWQPDDEEIIKTHAIARATSDIRQQIHELRTSEPSSIPSAHPGEVTPIISERTPELDQVITGQSIADLQARLSVAENLKTQAFKGNRGKLRINLKWDTLDDLDLHVHLPDKQEIYYQSKRVSCQGFDGELDVDANAGSDTNKTPQENVFWETGLPVGTFEISVVHYYKNELERVPFALTIIPEFEEPLLLTGIAEFIENEKTPLKVARFTVAEDSGFTIIPLLQS